MLPLQIGKKKEKKKFLTCKLKNLKAKTFCTEAVIMMLLEEKLQVKNNLISNLNFCQLRQ